jgi:hypothetical protein
MPKKLVKVTQKIAVTDNPKYFQEIQSLSKTITKCRTEPSTRPFSCRHHNFSSGLFRPAD